MAAASPPIRWTASARSWRAMRDGAPARRRVLFDAAAAGLLPVVKPPAPPVASGQVGRRPATQFPLLRQPAEISAVREHLQREMGNRARVGLELANIHPRPPAVRVFDAGVGDGTVLARVMRSMHDRFPDHAVLYRRQGDQPRRHPPHAAQDGRPLRRASLDGAGAHQSRLCGSALAGGEIAERRHQPGVERAGDGRQHRAQLRAADHRARAVPRRELEGAGRRRRAAIRSTSVRSFW